MTLNDMIGIDKSVIAGFTVLKLDESKLRTQERLAIDGNGAAYSIRVNESPNSIVPNHNIDSITIEDKTYGKLDIRMKKRHGVKRLSSSIQIHVGNDNNDNSRSLKAQEYKSLVGKMNQHFSEVYGITLDLSTVHISKIELNATFYLDEPFSNYKNALKLIMANVPSYNEGNPNKILSWESLKADQRILETTLLKNSTTQLKIYDKRQQLIDMGVIPYNSITRPMMRVEYTFSAVNTIQSRLGETLEKITDKAIAEMFGYFFNRDVIEPCNAWRQQNASELTQALKKHMSEKRYWFDDFLRECRQIEVTKRHPLLFSLEDAKTPLKDVLKALERNPKNSSRMYATLVKYAQYEGDLLGNTKRLEEIITKTKNLIERGTSSDE